jgi:hypothetical protein
MEFNPGMGTKALLQGSSAGNRGCVLGQFTGGGSNYFHV